MNSIKNKSLKIPISILEAILFICMMYSIFFSTYSESLNTIISFIMGICIILYTIFYIIVILLVIPSLTIMFIRTYTNLLDDKVEPSLPTVNSWYKVIFYWIKRVVMICLLLVLDYNFLSIIIFIMLITSITYKFIQRDFIVKMVKLSLTWRE